jgi:two-component system chemotaxis sensor kinase CheA
MYDLAVLPHELLQQFRVMAVERLDRIEAAWAAVIHARDDEAAVTVHRELHTLKGESKMLGFGDVNLVCNKLEDLLEAARAHGYAIDEDFDFTFHLALRFMAMLARKKPGSELGGIDLPGLVRQIDGMVAELRPEPRARTTSAMQPLRATTRMPRVPAALRTLLEPVAVDAFVEYAAATRARRDRLRTSWHALRELIGMHPAALGPAQLDKHREHAVALARELGKAIDVVFEIETVEATAELVAAIDAAVLHLVRNAIDHGIEPPAERTAAGKPARGAIRVCAATRGGELVLTVEDDGRGVAFADVLARAIERGLVDAHVTDIRERWLDLVCQPGFTTRANPTDVSGRGAGLDAVRAGLVEAGGALTAETRANAGTSWRAAIPLPTITLDVHLLRVPNLPFPVAIDARWQLVEMHEGAPVFDLAHRLGFADERSLAEPRYFTLEHRTVAIRVERDPIVASARRIVASTPPAAFEVAQLGTSEGLLVYPDRLR